MATIARVYVGAGRLNPRSSEAVRLGLKKMERETSARQDQAHSLGWKDIKVFFESAREGLRADRERAMLCIAYETIVRRGEFVALQVRDIDFHPDGTGQAYKHGDMSVEPRSADGSASGHMHPCCFWPRCDLQALIGCDQSRARSASCGRSPRASKPRA
jgi:hypothetical protein